MRPYISLYIVCYLLLLQMLPAHCLFAQQADSIHLITIREQLNALAKRDTAYNARVDISVSSLPLVELLRGLGRSNRLNLNASVPPEKTVSCHFTQTRLADLLLFLCNEYSLTTDTIGGILSLRSYAMPSSKDYMIPDESHSIGFNSDANPDMAMLQAHGLTSQVSVRVIPLRYRTVDKVIEWIPESLKQGIEVIAFGERNSLIINGERGRVMQIMDFLKEIDQSVPLVSIDVILVDASKDFVQNLGISSGKGQKEISSSGSLSPGINVNLGAATINKVTEKYSPVNIGQVSSLFYTNLQMLEENGDITLRSTPRLATLNGHKATLKSGATKYYKETQSNLIGTQNPIQSSSYQWKSIEANFTLEITPYVSQDSCITMSIDLSQCEFAVRESSEEDAPPCTTTRSFNSIIRVRNADMVLLGGIERTSEGLQAKGLPFIARVPILRWLFGTTKKSKNSQKLSVFIKPTILY